MPANPRWYPDELPALAQSSSSTSALETAVRTLQNDARTQSIRQALSRRSAGVIAAAEQNRGAIVIGSLMPLVIDPIARSQPATQTVAAVGTVGYVAGGAGSTLNSRTTDKLTIATDTFTGLGERMIYGHKGRVAASNLRSGIYAGGSASFGTDGAFGTGEIEEFSYATETSATLSFSSFGFGHIAAGAFSSTSSSFFVGVSESSSPIRKLGFDSKQVSQVAASFGGIHFFSSFGTPSRCVVIFSLPNWGARGVNLFSFATESVSRNPTLPYTNYAASDRQVLGNGSSGWLFGGTPDSPTSIYRYSPAAASFTQIAAASPSVRNAATIGSSAVGYLCGGVSGGIYHFWNSFYTNSGVQSCSKFTYSTESIAALPSTLTLARSHPVGISNFAGAFV